ncbi:hypothetical protein FRC02_003061 [Tulasnella sp. 418]|nr:hypothetical protein FRC02_003061 [Tulasnella sp. 418]
MMQVWVLHEKEQMDDIDNDTITLNVGGGLLPTRTPSSVNSPAAGSNISTKDLIAFCDTHHMILSTSPIPYITLPFTTIARIVVQQPSASVDKVNPALIR